MSNILRIPILSGALALSVLASAQFGTPPVISVKVESVTVPMGKSVNAVVTIKFSEGLHAYANPSSDPSLIPVKITAGDKSVTLIKVNYPKGTPTKVEGEPKPVYVYAGTIQIPVTVQVPAKPGKATIKLKVGYQQCNNQSCFPPSTFVAEAVVNVLKQKISVKPMAAPKGK